MTILGRQRRRGAIDEKEAEDVCAVLVILHIFTTLGIFDTRTPFTDYFLCCTFLINGYSLEVKYMPSRKPRVALTVPDDINSTLDRLSDLTGTPKTKLILEMLEEYLPILDRTISALEQIQADKANAPNIAKQFASELLLEGNEKLGVLASEAKKL